MSPSIWLVTGSTSGIGAALVNHIVARGDKVIASGRNIEKKLGHLKSDSIALLELDVSAGKDHLDSQIQKAWTLFGHVDILVNNAGMAALRTIEDADGVYVDNMFRVNLFGPMYLTQAALPLFRAQGHGCISFTSSASGWMALPLMSHYAMSKSALGVFAESLHKEMSSLGIRAVAFDLGGFDTHLSHPREGDKPGTGSLPPSSEAYMPLFADFNSMFTGDTSKHTPGDPTNCASTMFDVIKREGVAAGKPWAVRVVLGSDGLDFGLQRRQQEMKLLNEWRAVSTSTDGREYEPQEKMLSFGGMEGTS